MLIYSKAWEGGRLLSAWKVMAGILIRKPGKLPSKLLSYWLMALTSNVCKMMERITFEFEKRVMLASYQNGFRNRRNSTNSVITLKEKEYYMM